MNVYICSAARTAIGTYGGTLRDVPAAQLGIAAANAAVERAGVDKAAIDECLFGQVLQGGVGQNVARQVSLGIGMPLETPAMTLNKVCASSMRAISLGSQIIRSGEDQMMLVGGCESMSGAPYISRNMRWGARMNDVKFVDMMVYDGVFDVFNQYHMGITAENVAEKYGITREMQDQIGGHAAGGLAGRLARSLALAAATGLNALGQVTSCNGLNSFHDKNLSNTIIRSRLTKTAWELHVSWFMIARFGAAVKNISAVSVSPTRGRRLWWADRSKWCGAPLHGLFAAGSDNGTKGPDAHRSAVRSDPGLPPDQTS